MDRKSKRTTLASAFTLLELLIVMGIILVLIGILVPVAGKVRQSAQTANTKQMFVRIEAGIQAYFSDFQAYPGPIFNAQIGTQPTLGPTGAALAYWYKEDAITPLAQDTSRVNITATENLFLGLVGGLTLTPNFRASIDYTTLPNGPASLNTANPKRYQSYISIESAELSSGVTARQYQGNARGLGGASDTRIPEIMDRYPQPMPILYMRAIRGNDGAWALDNSRQYNLQHLAAYGFTAISAADYPANGADGGIAGAFDYFGNKALSATAAVPSKKDEFILISAGPDGIYGTRDDITNFR